MPVLTGPQAPASVTAVPGDTTATVSWTAPASLDGATLTGYTATAAPGGEACTTTGEPPALLPDSPTAPLTASPLSLTQLRVIQAPARPRPSPPLAARPLPAAPLTTAAFGTPFTFTVTATGSPAPRITRTGRLPSGVRFSEQRDGTATISGTPAKAASGVYPLTLTARNKTGTATQAFTLTVTRVPAFKHIPAIRTGVGVPLDLTIRATGYPAPAVAEAGSLPGGLSFTDNGNGTAAIAGTPAANSAGRYPITISATNTSGTATRHFTIVVLKRRR